MMQVRSVRAALVAVALSALSACGGSSDGGSEASSPASAPPAAAADPAATAATSPAGEALLVAKALIDRTDETSEPVSLASVGTADRSEADEPVALR